MSFFPENFLSSHPIDFEYKKYILMAFLRDTRNDFEEQKLYPRFQELVQNYNNFISIKNSKDKLKDSFHKDMIGYNSSNNEIIYESQESDDKTIKEIEAIIDFSIGCMKVYVDDGKKIYDNIEKSFKIETVGVFSNYKQEGYVFIKNGANSKIAKIYQYDIKLVEEFEVIGIHFCFIKNEKLTLKNSYENIKIKLLRKFENLPNPSVYLIETEKEIPFEETFLPIAKRCLLGIVHKSNFI